MNIEAKDLIIDVCSSSEPIKMEYMIRLTHIPTGTIIESVSDSILTARKDALNALKDKLSAMEGN